MIGKVNDDFFRRAVLPYTGAALPEVLTGPRMGVDAAVLRVGDQFMAVAEDPIFPGPGMDPETLGWVTVHIGASDVAVTGIPPRFMTYSLLLPPGTPEPYVERLVKSISESARELGISIVGGHTGYYDTVTTPIIGGITVWGFGSEAITAAGAQPGDRVIITKGAAVEAAAVIACAREAQLKARGVDPALLERAKARIREMSVVKDALTATAAGGVHAMHDATEGGLARGLWEVAEASGVGLRIYRERIPVPADIAAVCDAVGLNPLEVISEGTLVITCAAEKADGVMAVLESAGIPTAAVGEIVPAADGRVWVEANGSSAPLLPPAEDRFWAVLASSPEAGAESAAAQRLCAELEEAAAALEGADVAHLIPEIGANLAYALPSARRLDEVAAIPGRFRTVRGKVVRVAKPAMGVSHHMGGSLLLVREFFPEARCVINLRNNEAVRRVLATLPWQVVEMPPVAGYRQTDVDWGRDLRATMAACRTLPDVIAIPDRLNLERLILVLGVGLPETVEKVKLLAQRVRAQG